MKEKIVEKEVIKEVIVEKPVIKYIERDPRNQGSAKFDHLDLNDRDNSDNGAHSPFERA